MIAVVAGFLFIAIIIVVLIVCLMRKLKATDDVNEPGSFDACCRVREIALYR